MLGALLLSLVWFSGSIASPAAFASRTSPQTSAIPQQATRRTALLSLQGQAARPVRMSYRQGYRLGYRQGYRDGLSDCSIFFGRGATNSANRGYADGYDAGHRAACGDSGNAGGTEESGE